MQDWIEKRASIIFATISALSYQGSWKLDSGPKNNIDIIKCSFSWTKRRLPTLGNLFCMPSLCIDCLGQRTRPLKSGHEATCPVQLSTLAKIPSGIRKPPDTCASPCMSSCHEWWVTLAPAARTQRSLPWDFESGFFLTHSTSAASSCNKFTLLYACRMRHCKLIPQICLVCGCVVCTFRIIDSYLLPGHGNC